MDLFHKTRKISQTSFFSDADCYGVYQHFNDFALDFCVLPAERTKSMGDGQTGVTVNCGKLIGLNCYNFPINGNGREFSAGITVRECKFADMVRGGKKTKEVYIEVPRVLSQDNIKFYETHIDKLSPADAERVSTFWQHVG